MSAGHQPRARARWLLPLIAAPAAVAIWSGWVALGGLCGFGIVHPLPGIAPGFELNTAITLPVGVEAYGAYALGVYLGAADIPPEARTFAKRSAAGALLLGAAGQVILHLLLTAHAKAAPWPVVVLVSCMPIAVLGLAAALTHLLRRPAETGAVADEPGKVPADVVEAARVSYRATVAAGNPWSRNQLVTQCGLTRPQADEIRAGESPAPSDVAGAVLPTGLATAAPVTLNGSGPHA